MHPVTLRAFSDELQKIAQEELEKRALIERLVRLGATDVPGTEHIRFLMRHRSNEELANLQQHVENLYQHGVSPLHRAADWLATKLPEHKAKELLRTGAHKLIDNPLPAAAWASTPIPGVFEAALAGQVGLEKAIDKFAPLKATPTIPPVRLP